MGGAFDATDLVRHERDRQTDDMDPIQSAVIVALPDAESAVARWRAELDVWAGRGVPAHVTVVTPFLPPAEINDAAVEALAAVIATVPAFEVDLARTAWFGREVLWLDPEPSGPFRALTEQVWRRFPQCPPYEGAHADLIPHLTIGFDAPRPDLQRAERIVTAALPIHTRVTHARLICGSLEPNSWRTVTEFPLR